MSSFDPTDPEFWRAQLASPDLGEVDVLLYQRAQLRKEQAKVRSALELERVKLESAKRHAEEVKLLLAACKRATGDKLARLHARLKRLGYESFDAAKADASRRNAEKLEAAEKIKAGKNLAAQINAEAIALNVGGMAKTSGKDDTLLEQGNEAETALKAAERALKAATIAAQLAFDVKASYTWVILPKGSNPMLLADMLTIGFTAYPWDMGSDVWFYRAKPVSVANGRKLANEGDVYHGYTSRSLLVARSSGGSFHGFPMPKKAPAERKMSGATVATHWLEMD